MNNKTLVQEENYKIDELKVLEIIKTLKKCRIYLSGNKFKIFIDLSVFTMTQRKYELTSKLAKCLFFLARS